MNEMILFTVIGTPKPGGSKTAFPTKSGRIAIVDASGKKGREWRQDVKHEALRAMEGKEILENCAIDISATFHMPRPKSHYFTGKRAGVLRPDAPLYHTHKPDATKLIRSVEDACTGIVWKDDCMIARQYVVKVYCEEKTMAGVSMVIRKL